LAALEGAGGVGAQSRRHAHLSQLLQPFYDRAAAFGEAHDVHLDFSDPFATLSPRTVDEIAKIFAYAGEKAPCNHPFSRFKPCALWKPLQSWRGS